MLPDLPRRAARYLHRRFVLAPLGRGWPVEQDAWDKAYASGAWDFLFSIEEMPHQMVTLGYVVHLHPQPRVLDVGCGSGRFLDMFRNFPRAAYHGIDLSASAIDKARQLGVPDATFEVASFEDWDGGDRRFDVIVFDEVFWYAKNPVETLRRFQRWLDADGAVVISLFREGNTLSTLGKLEAVMPRIGATEVRDPEKGKVWDVRALAQPGAKPAPRGSGVAEAESEAES